MRAYPLVAAAALALATPSVAFAQDALPPDTDAALTEMSERLADPEFQAQASVVAQVLVGSMLDMKVGPLAEAMRDMRRSLPNAGDDDSDTLDIDPDARLRDLAPNADELPEQMAERVPQAMSAMSGIGEGLRTMLPALLSMAEQMRGSFEQTRPVR